MLNINTFRFILQFQRLSDACLQRREVCALGAGGENPGLRQAHSLT